MRMNSRGTEISLTLRRVLVAHAIITAAAGVVLVARPALIPATVGIRLGPDEYLLCYLLAAAEFGFAALSGFGARLADPAGVRVVVWSCVVLHASSGLLEGAFLVQHPVTALGANVIARIVIVGLFLWLLRQSRRSEERRFFGT